MTLKVLYLDDEIELCENFSDSFASETISVLTFTDPATAVAAAKNNRPDIIFVDYRLPATTGDKIAQSMDPSIPKFLITGDISVETVYKFIKIFSKPYDSADIQSVLNEYNI